MSVLLRGASPSLYWEQEPNTGGFRCMVRAFLTCQDFVFWWYFPPSQSKGNYFYGKDLHNIVQNIRLNGALFGSLPLVAPDFNDPSLDVIRSYSITIRGSKMSNIMGYNGLCTMSENNNVVDIAIRQLNPSFINVRYTTIDINNAVITTYNHPNRGENNALCSFHYGSSYSMPDFFLKE